MKNAKTLATLSMFLATAIILGYVERLVPSPVPALPGIKLGLANGVFIILLYLRDFKTAALVNILRILLIGMLFTGVNGMLYALSGALLSMPAMLLAKKCRVFGLVGISVLGAVMHNFGQVAFGAFLVNNIMFFYYLPVLLFSGIITGIVVGLVSGNCISRLEPVLRRGG